MSASCYLPLSTPLGRYVDLPFSPPIYTGRTLCRRSVFFPYLHRLDTMSISRFLSLSTPLRHYVDFPLSPPIYIAKALCRPAAFYAYLHR